MVLDLQDTLVGVDDPEVDDGGYAGGDVVSGYYLLGRHLHSYGSEVNLDHLVYYRKEDEESWSFRPSLHPTEPKDHTPLVLLDDLDGAKYDRRHHYDDHHKGNEREAHADGLQQT